MACLNGRLFTSPTGKNYSRGMFDDNLTDHPIVFETGAWLGATSSIPAAVAVFDGALYVSATIQRQGRKGLDRFGPFPAEMIRVHPDDSWDLVTGKPRFTPHGLKRPITGLPGGFGDRYTHAFWRMAVQDGQLYVGTAGWRWMPTYLRGRTDLSGDQLATLRAASEAAQPGEFAIWSTRDGNSWDPITRDGFPGSSPQNYGVREMLATPHGLFVAPTSKMGSIRGGGLELWWGRT
jgi:hypothetical protein